MKTETGRMRERDLDESFSLSALSPPVVHCRTRSPPPPPPPSLPPSVRQTAIGRLPLLLLTRSRVSLIQPEPPLPPSPSKYAFYISLLSSPDPSSSPSSSSSSSSARTRRSLQLTRAVRELKSYMSTSVTSACNQSLFGLLHLLLATCLCSSCHRLLGPALLD